MKFTSLFTRLGLVAFGFILVAVLNEEGVWSEPASTTPTTIGLAESLLFEWGFALLALGLLMAMAMMGAAYLVRDERMENLLWEFGTDEAEVAEVEEEDDADDAVEEDEAHESEDEEEAEIAEESEEADDAVEEETEESEDGEEAEVVEVAEESEEPEEADIAQEAEAAERQARMVKELEERRNRLESLDEKARKKEEELIRVAEKAKTIDFSTLGFASASDADDLQRIKGVGPFIAEKLNALGIYTFGQLANMTPEIEEQVNVAIEFFSGRIRRDEWADQARTFLRGEEE